MNNKNIIFTFLVVLGLAAFGDNSFVIEGENAQGAIPLKDSRASCGLVAQSESEGCSLVFENIEIENAGNYSLTLETFADQIKNVSLIVNDSKPITKKISPGYDNTAGIGTWEVKLAVGKHTFSFKGESCELPAVDKFTLTRIPEISETAGRFTISMDFGWKFKWGKAKKENVTEASFDDKSWQSVNLPHDAQFEQPWTRNNSSGARGFKPMGEMWYRNAFKTEDLGVDIASRRVFLELGGLLCCGTIYLNGKNVAECDYGYLPVCADITDAIKPEGENIIAIWCTTGKREGSRWYTGAGLYRDAKIIVKPQISLMRNSVFLKSRQDGKSAIVNASVQLDGFTKRGNKIDLEVAAEIFGPDGKLAGSAKCHAPWSKNAHQEVALPEIKIDDAKLWDIDEPNLYTAKVSLFCDGTKIDEETRRFGVRTIELDYEYGMKLNGRKIFLKSMSNHHDMGCVGVAAYRRAIERQFKLMKAFGYNSVRCSHNPYSEDFYDLADEMGILVMDELVDKWSDSSYWFGRKPFTSIWPYLVTEWMKRDRNHPSIFSWSFGNELQMRDDLCGYAGLDDWGVTMYKVIKAFSERWDTTRPTTVAMFPAREGAISKKDPGFWNNPKAPEMALVTDFASLNYQSPVYKDYVRNAPGLNIFQSEAEAYVLQRAYLNMDQAHSIGCSYWGAIEYWGESNSWPKKGWNYSFFTHALEPKPSAYLIKSVMSDEPVVRIAVKTGEGTSMTWNDVQVGFIDEESIWEGKDGEMKSIRVYTNEKDAELFLNGKSLGKKYNDSKESDKKNILTWEVPFEPGELKAVCESVSQSVKTAGAAARLDVEIEGENFKADGKDLIYVKCRVVDEAGTPVRAWNNKVEARSTGSAEFFALDDDDQYTDDLFTSDRNVKNARNGFILAVFKTNLTPGEAEIEISADGLEKVVRRVTVGE